MKFESLDNLEASFRINCSNTVNSYSWKTIMRSIFRKGMCNVDVYMMLDW